MDANQPTTPTVAGAAPQVPVTPAPTLEQSPSSGSKSKLIWIVAAVVILILLAGGAYYYLNMPKGSVSVGTSAVQAPTISESTSLQNDLQSSSDGEVTADFKDVDSDLQSL